METLKISIFLMLLTRALTRAPLKESHPIYISSSASSGIAYIGMISKNQNAYGTLDQSQDYGGNEGTV